MTRDEYVYHVMKARQEYHALTQRCLGEPYNYLRNITFRLDKIGADYSVLEEGKTNEDVCAAIQAALAQHSLRYANYQLPAREHNPVTIRPGMWKEPDGLDLGKWAIFQMQSTSGRTRL